VKKSKLVLITNTLLGLMVLAGCSPGWSIGEFELSNNDSSYIEIVDSDSILHFYDKYITLDVDVWCYVHAQYEIIRKK